MPYPHSPRFCYVTSFLARVLRVRPNFLFPPISFPEPSFHVWVQIRQKKVLVIQMLASKNTPAIFNGIWVLQDHERRGQASGDEKQFSSYMHR